MAERIVTRCPFCGKPHSVNLSTFESVASSPLSDDYQPSGPGSSVLSEALRLLAVVGLGTVSTWAALALSDLYYPPYWLSPVVGLGLAVTLEAARLWLYRPQVAVKEQAGGVVVRVEQVSDDNRHWVIQDFDDRLSLAHFQHVAKQIERGAGFTRAALCKPGVLSQQQFHTLKADLLRLNFLVPLPANAPGYTLTLRGKAFFRKIPTRQQ